MRAESDGPTSGPYFSDRQRPLRIVNDPGVGDPFGVKAEEVDILCDKNPAGRSSECQLYSILRASQPCLVRGSDVNVTTSQAGCDTRGQVLVQMKPDRHRIRVLRSFASPRAVVRQNRLDMTEFHPSVVREFGS